MFEEEREAFGVVVSIEEVAYFVTVLEVVVGVIVESTLGMIDFADGNVV